jgi:SSS family solute:Na+ symporter
MAAKNMSAARRTPLIAAIPKMIFPILVILPGMIAAGLAFESKDGYRIPPARIDTAKYVAAIEVVRHPAAPDQTLAELSKATGKKMLPDKVASLVRDNAATPLGDEVLKERIQGAVAENDYDGVILSLVKRYCPTGLLGLALTALLASFMSGMAGNVTAFNTVWTYDLYQAYIAPNKSDEHYMWMGRSVTVVGVLLSIAAAYFASSYNNAMDVIQLVFGFVNAPLFATFLLGMFWSRCTSHGAFFGLIGGTATSVFFHALTLAAGNAPGIKGGYLSVAHIFPSEMAQNFWLATFAFLVCFLLTGGISLVTKRTKTDAELKGLVYSLTPKLKDDEQSWYLRPAIFGSGLLVVCVALNILFW